MYTEKCFRRPKTMNSRPFTADATIFRRTLDRRHAAVALNLRPLEFFPCHDLPGPEARNFSNNPFLSSHIPNPLIPPPPAPPLCAASPCIFSLTFKLTSKNLLTHRSKHTLSPLLRSPSRYSGGMHFFEQEWESL